MEVLASHLVTFNEEKCIFAAKTIEFVGFWLTTEGLSSLHSNVQVFLQLPEPTPPAQILSLLGMANFYGRFIPYYSEMIEPLCTLLKQDALWKWIPACSAAIGRLKTQLYCWPTLTYKALPL
ncbi:uncharacterized protein KZ484_006514 [Pholidichthys leucotaenia]